MLHSQAKSWVSPDLSVPHLHPKSEFPLASLESSTRGHYEDKGLKRVPSAFTVWGPGHVEGRGHPSVCNCLRQSLWFVSKDFILNYVYVPMGLNT